MNRSTNLLSNVGEVMAFEDPRGNLVPSAVNYAIRGTTNGDDVGTALVGSYVEVADRMMEYHQLGFDEFILSGYPHLEEAYQFGEGVMPILRGRLDRIRRRRRVVNVGAA